MLTRAETQIAPLRCSSSLSFSLHNKSNDAKLACFGFFFVLVLYVAEEWT